jgi:hypothetical protein
MMTSRFNHPGSCKLGILLPWPTILAPILDDSRFVVPKAICRMARSSIISGGSQLASGICPVAWNRGHKVVGSRTASFKPSTMPDSTGRSPRMHNRAFRLALLRCNL